MYVYSSSAPILDTKLKCEKATLGHARSTASWLWQLMEGRLTACSRGIQTGRLQQYVYTKQVRQYNVLRCTVPETFERDCWVRFCTRAHSLLDHEYRTYACTAAAATAIAATTVVFQLLLQAVFASCASCARQTTLRACTRTCVGDPVAAPRFSTAVGGPIPNVMGQRPSIQAASTKLIRKEESEIVLCEANA